MAPSAERLPFRCDGADLVLRLKVTPGARIAGFEGIAEGPGSEPLMKLKVRAKPQDGEANEAVIAAVAEAFGQPRSAISIESGRSARIKTIRITGAAGAARRAEELVRS